MMQAINYYIIIDKIKEAPKTIGGIELTESQNSDVRYLRGEVISVGDQISVIKPGDIVRYDKHAGAGVEYENKLYYVIKIPDVVIVE